MRSMRMFVPAILYVAAGMVSAPASTAARVTRDVVYGEAVDNLGAVARAPR